MSYPQNLWKRLSVILAACYNAEYHNNNSGKSFFMSAKHIFFAVLVAAIWGINFVFVKLGTSEVPPLFLCAVRFFFASVPAVFFMKWPTTSFKMVAAYGLVMFGLQFALVFTGMAVGMTPGMASLIMQTQIFFSIFFAACFLGEVPTFWQIGGGLVALCGMLLIGMHVDANMTLAGLLFIIGGAATWGIGNLITKKLGKVNMMSLVVWASLVACLPLLLMSFLVEGPEKISYSLQHFSWIAVVSLIYIVLVSTWAGYGIWNSLLSHYPVTTVVPFTLLVPVFGIMASILIMGEQFTLWKLTASLLVIAGLCINLLGPRLFRKKIVADF